MSGMQRGTVPAPWRALGESLAGSFAASALGFLASDLVLRDREGSEIGRMRTVGPEGAELTAGGVKARIERAVPARYRMLSCGAEILASTGDPVSPGITCLNRPYRARMSLLRNRAEAGPAGNEAVVRIAGGLTNRRYEVTCGAEDEGSLPVALFLLYRIVTLRRAAYRAGPSA